VIARSAWKNQFVLQWRTFQRKFSEFWLNTVESQHTNPRGLWRVVNDILKPPLEVQTKNLRVDDLESHFHNKIADISRSTANAPPPPISPRSVPSLTVFDPVTEQEVAVLIKKTPAKSCPLDPIPTWLLKEVATYITPVISRLYNLSLLSGFFSSALKHALVYSRIKKSSLDPHVLNTDPFQTFHTYPN